MRAPYRVGELPTLLTPGPLLVHIASVCKLEATARLATYPVCGGSCSVHNLFKCPRDTCSLHRALRYLSSTCSPSRFHPPTEDSCCHWRLTVAAARMAASFQGDQQTLTPNLSVQVTFFSPLQPQDFLEPSCLMRKGQNLSISRLFLTKH